MADDKKSEELKILKLWFGDALKSIIYREQPDFEVSDGAETFGVEITQFFVDQSSARMKNIKDYVTKITEENWIHKDDKNTLESIDVWAQNDDGSETYLGRAVRRPNPTWAEKVHILNKVIIDKNNKFTDYDKSYERIDLIIYDNGDLRSGTDTRELFGCIQELVTKGELNALFKNLILIGLENGKITSSFILKG